MFSDAGEARDERAHERAADGGRGRGRGDRPRHAQEVHHLRQKVSEAALHSAVLTRRSARPHVYTRAPGRRSIVTPHSGMRFATVTAKDVVCAQTVCEKVVRDKSE